MRRRVIYVTLDRYKSSIRGWGSRDLLEEVMGRAPVYRRDVKAWGCQDTTAQDVIALAEVRGYDVVITGPPSTTPASPREADLDVGLVNVERIAKRVSQPEDPGAGLW